VDHLHLVIVPVILGGGENLLAGLNLNALGYHAVETVAGEGALHLVYKKA
jgi:riboflavin biosynthesis pyrimidine reductase